ncbi:hypothetical protein V8C40DRAFT_245346 [Trichoderma camerunense]
MEQYTAALKVSTRRTAATHRGHLLLRLLLLLLFPPLLSATKRMARLDVFVGQQVPRVPVLLRGNSPSVPVPHGSSGS